MRTAPAVIRTTAAANRTTVNTYGAYPETADAIRRKVDGRKTPGQPPRRAQQTSWPAWDAGDEWRGFTCGCPKPARMSCDVPVLVEESADVVASVELVDPDRRAAGERS
jgi:hypothetical protein